VIRLLLPLSILRYMTPYLPAPDSTPSVAWRTLSPYSSNVSLSIPSESLLENIKFEGFLSREMAVGGGVMLAGSLDGEAMVLLLMSAGEVTVRSRSEPLRRAILTVISHMLKS
jgi:hypothetical protein